MTCRGNSASTLGVIGTSTGNAVQVRLYNYGRHFLSYSSTPKGDGAIKFDGETKYFCKSMRTTKNSVYATKRNLLTPVMAGVILSACLYTARVSAIPLAPGGTVPAAAGGGGVGGSFVTSTTDPFSSSSFSGTVTSTVMRNDPANPFGPSSGFLTFTYSIMLSGGPQDLSAFSVGSYGGYLADVSFTPNGGVPPTQVVRTSGTGDTITFQWMTGGGLPPGTSSALLVIETDATMYQVATGGVIDDNPTDLNNLLGPILMPSAVPDSTETATLLVAGLGALFVFRRCQFKPAIVRA